MSKLQMNLMILQSKKYFKADYGKLTFVKNKEKQNMKFIVIEGLNGAGKSSLAKAIALKINGRYIASPHESIAQLRTVMDEVSLLAHFFYYMLGNILISDDLKKNKSDEIIICDRYIDSTLARHEVLGLEVKDFNVSLSNLQEPDISFFIYCEEIERRSRIEERGKKNKWDILDEDNQSRKAYIDYFYKKQKFHFFNTSNETVDESLNRMLSILSEEGII